MFFFGGSIPEKSFPSCPHFPLLPRESPASFCSHSLKLMAMPSKWQDDLLHCHIKCHTCAKFLSWFLSWLSITWQSECLLAQCLLCHKTLKWSLIYSIGKISLLNSIFRLTVFWSTVDWFNYELYSPKNTEEADFTLQNGFATEKRAVELNWRL